MDGTACILKEMMSFFLVI